MLSSKLRTARRALDERLRAYSGLETSAPQKGWLRAIREALGMTGQQLADRLAIAWPSMDDLEKSEAAGTITLASLRRVAAALECDVVVAVVPRAGSLDATVEARARHVASLRLAEANQTMTLEQQAVADGSSETWLKDYIHEHLRDRDLWSRD